MLYICAPQALGAEQRAAEGRERAARLAHCAPELALLGLAAAEHDAADVDEKVLRRDKCITWSIT